MFTSSFAQDDAEAKKLEKQKKREENEKRKRVLESCLTLVRALYSHEEVKTINYLIFIYRKMFKTL